ncbi:hypothetical protein F4810DRAFT_669629 [Camillea tinctor]|nr:hypothetical protein F4810DRAFT_669629 [Camillea tinctor]
MYKMPMHVCNLLLVCSRSNISYAGILEVVQVRYFDFYAKVSNKPPEHKTGVVSRCVYSVFRTYLRSCMWYTPA